MRHGHKKQQSKSDRLAGNDTPEKTAPWVPGFPHESISGFLPEAVVSSPQSAKPTIKIEIFLDPSDGAPPVAGELENRAAAYAGTAVQDLAIPAEVSVTARHESIKGAPFRIQINGKPCRMPLKQWPPPDSTEQRVLDATNVIHANRELLIDSRLASDVRAAWFSDSAGNYLPGLDRRNFHGYLKLLLRHCFRLDRGDHLRDSAGFSIHPWTADYCFEQAVRSLENLKLVLYRAPETRPRNEAAKPPEQILSLMQQGLFYELGIKIPRIESRCDAGLRAGEWQTQINDLRMPIFRGLSDREFLVNETPARLAPLNVKGRSAANPANGAECTVVEETGGLAEICQKAGFTTWDAQGYAVLAASGQLRRHASAFIVLQSIEHDLDLMKGPFPGLISCVRERFTLDRIAQIFRYLLDEEISLLDLRKILEALLAVKATLAEDLSKFIVFTPYVTLPCLARNVTDVKQLSAAHYGECVRMRLRRYISHKYTRGSSSLVVYLLDPAIESRVVEATDRPVTDGEREKILHAIFEEVGSLPQSTHNPVILTTLEARRPFRDLIEFEFPYLSVLSYQELSPEMNIQPIARISMDK
jgi:hypothetical protein